MWDVEQHYEDLIIKMNLDLKPDCLLLDVGCGDGVLTEYLADTYAVHAIGSDPKNNECWRNSTNRRIELQRSSVYSLPFNEDTFDYVFMKDVLHHIDEPDNDPESILRGLEEIERVCKPEGRIIILESNRYTPISYPHMVLLRGHKHLSYRQFLRILGNFEYTITSFESHVYPKLFRPIFKIYEPIMECIVQKVSKLCNYNLAILENIKD